MLRLARATTPWVPDDVYETYRHWAWLRYLGAFRLLADGSLGLSASGAKVSGNQRRVLSEELGIGFGVLLAEHWCRRLGARGPISVTDVDLVLRDGFPGASIDTGTGRQPDYLLQYPNPVDSSVKVVKVLECKGTQSVSSAPKQLARASTQLASLTLSGKTPQGVAISTISSARAVQYMAIDPDGGDVEWTDATLSIDDARRPKATAHSIGVTTDVDPTDFLSTATAVALGSLADFAGDSSTASAWLPAVTSRRLGRRERARIHVESRLGAFVGQEIHFPAPGTRGTLRVVQAIAIDVDGALRARDYDGVRTAQLRFADLRAEDGDLGESVSPDGAARVEATSPDGAFLSIEIVGR